MKNVSIFFHDSKPFSQLVGLAFLFLLGFILASGLQILLPSAYSSPSEIRLGLVMQCIAQLLMFFMPALLFTYLYKGDMPTFLQLDFCSRKWVLAGVAIVLFLLLIPMNDWITWWNDQWNMGSLEPELRKLSEASINTVDKMLSLTGVGDLLLQLFVVALIPAVCEELFFRGALQQMLRQWFGNPHAAIIVAALVFTLAHGDIYGLVPRFVLGVLLGYLFYLSGSMLVNVCAHFFNNAIIVVFYYLYHHGIMHSSPDAPMFLPWYTTLLCTLAAIALFILYFTQKGEKKAPKNTI